eukprot:606872-Pleurochrysis_carterae.AAC.2
MQINYNASNTNEHDFVVNFCCVSMLSCVFGPLCRVQVVIHWAEHCGERDYALGINQTAEEYPHFCTSLNIDAPTQDEFNLPVQNRVAQDVVKSLESAP